MSAERIDVLAVTREMRERHVARHFKSPTLIAWADRIDAAVAQREAAVAELIEAGKRVTNAFRALGTAGGMVEVAKRHRECEAAMLAFDATLPRVQSTPEPTHADKLHDGARLHLAQGYDIETAKRMARDAIRAGEEDH